MRVIRDLSRATNAYQFGRIATKLICIYNPTSAPYNPPLGALRNPTYTPPKIAAAYKMEL